MSRTPPPEPGPDIEGRARFQGRWVALIVCLPLVCGALGYVASGYARSSQSHSPIKQLLPRDDVYYEINNDADDHGNYIETYHIPVGGNYPVKLFCVVYSDQIQSSGGGAGEACNWDAFNRGKPGDRPGWLKK